MTFTFTEKWRNRHEPNGGFLLLFPSFIFRSFRNKRQVCVNDDVHRCWWCKRGRYGIPSFFLPRFYFYFCQPHFSRDELFFVGWAFLPGGMRPVTSSCILPFPIDNRLATMLYNLQSLFLKSKKSNKKFHWQKEMEKITSWLEEVGTLSLECGSSRLIESLQAIIQFFIFEMVRK